MSLIKVVKNEVEGTISKNRIVLLKKIQSLTNMEFPLCLDELKYIDSYSLQPEEESTSCACGKKNIRKINLFLVNSTELIIGSCCIKFLLEYSRELLRLSYSMFINEDTELVHMDDEGAYKLISDLQSSETLLMTLLNEINNRKKCKICKKHKDLKLNEFCSNCINKSKIVYNNNQYYCKCLDCKRGMKLKCTAKGTFKLICWDCFKTSATKKFLKLI